MPRRPVDLAVLGLNYKTTDEDFKKYFETFGTVVFAQVKKNPDGSSRGYGFVQMSTLEEQDKIMETFDHTIDGRRCEIRIPDKKRIDANGKRIVTRRPDKIFVGRLTSAVTEETLRKFFDKEAKAVKESASVTNVQIPRPFRGFAFVTFSHSGVADKMVKSNNFVIDGMSVVVTFAVPRASSQQSGEPGSEVPTGYDFGSAYASPYGKGGAVYDETPVGLLPPAATEMFGYSPAGVFPRPPFEGWTAPPPAAQSTPRTSRGAGAAALQKGAQRPSPVVPPYMYARDPREGSFGQAASNQIASGLDALNLNQKNPELISAAWNAFFKTLNSGTAAAQPRKQQW
ncbi:hypothetical protein COOONC_06240 [Cooperia oncophora]